MSKDANSFGHDKALAWESRGFVYTKKRMHRFDTPSSAYQKERNVKIYLGMWGQTLLRCIYIIEKH